MKISAILILALLAALTIGCKSTTEPAAASFGIRDFFPTEFKWTYQETDYDNSGNQTSNYTISNDATKALDFRDFDTYTINNGTDSSAFYIDGDTALYWVDRHSASTILGYVYPMTEGQQIPIKDNGTEVEMLVLRKKSVPITVPAGTFDCLQYDVVYYHTTPGEPNDSMSVNTTYFCPKKGKIERDNYDLSTCTKWRNHSEVLKTLETKKS